MKRIYLSILLIYLFALERGADRLMVWAARRYADHLGEACPEWVRMISESEPNEYLVSEARRWFIQDWSDDERQQ